MVQTVCVTATSVDLPCNTDKYLNVRQTDRQTNTYLGDVRILHFQTVLVFVIVNVKVGEKFGFVEFRNSFRVGYQIVKRGLKLLTLAQSAPWGLRLGWYW